MKSLTPPLRISSRGTLYLSIYLFVCDIQLIIIIGFVRYDCTRHLSIIAHDSIRQFGNTQLTYNTSNDLFLIEYCCMRRKSRVWRVRQMQQQMHRWRHRLRVHSRPLHLCSMLVSCFVYLRYVLPVIYIYIIFKVFGWYNIELQLAIGVARFVWNQFHWRSHHWY